MPRLISKALKRHIVVLQVVSKYPELSVSTIWKYIRESKELMEYFPDYPEIQLPERDYMFAVVSTVFPKALRKLIEETRMNRTSKNKEMDNDLIEINKEIKEEIMKIISIKRKLNELH